MISANSSSFLPLPHKSPTEGDAVCHIVNDTNPLDWPDTIGEPLNEFKTVGFATMAFPTLFSFGRDDPTDLACVHEVSLSESFKHLTKFGQCNEDGTYTWRIAFHPQFPYWALNMKIRHQLLSQS